MAPWTGPFPVYTPDKRELSEDEIDVPPSARRFHFSHTPSAHIENRGHQVQSSTNPKTSTTPGTPQNLSLPSNSGSEMGRRSHGTVDILNLATLFCGNHSIEYLLNTLSSIAEITQDTLGWEADQREPGLLQVPRVVDPVPDVGVINSGDDDSQQSSRFALPNFLLDSTGVEELDDVHDKEDSQPDTSPRLNVGGNHGEEGMIRTRT